MKYKTKLDQKNKLSAAVFMELHVYR